MQGRIILILLYLLLKILNLHGQVNLVPNPSFEEYSLCPDKESQINRVVGWFSPSYGTPDYYNYCSSDPTLPSSLPIHTSYYSKIPRKGNGITGIFINQFQSNTGIKEYISVKLESKLKKNKIYFIEFYSSPRNGIPNIIIPCYVDKIGASLSNNISVQNTLPNQPLSKNKYLGTANKILDKIEEWTRISGCIFGDNEEYITIGSFNTNEQTLTNKECFDYFPNNAYYYIDDVGVYEFDPLPDTILLCDGDSKKIGQKFLDGTYQWNTGSQDSIIMVSNSGTYIVNVDMSSCILSDTVVVITMNDLDSYLPKDTTICYGTKLTIEIPITGTYLWNIGLINNSIDITNAGQYNVQVENECGTFNHSFTVMTQECDCQVHASNIFSPNDDGVNDDLTFYMDCQYEYHINSVRIYDRWGSLVFEEKKEMDDKIIWNGKLNGNTLSTGVYCWVINYSYTAGGKEISKVKSGNVTIIY